MLASLTYHEMCNPLMQQYASNATAAYIKNIK